MPLKPKEKDAVWAGPPGRIGELVPIGQLRLNPENPNDHSDPASIPAIMESLAEFGQQTPTVHDSNGLMRKGNGTLEAAERLGWSHIWSVETDLDDLQADGYSIADNETARFAKAHPERTAALLTRIREGGGNVSATGYTTERMEELLASMRQGETTNPDPGPGEPPKDPVSQTGDIWILGEHRLICGDSTNADDVARVMAGDQAALVATDPPYLVDYTGERPNDSGKDWTSTYREVDIRDADGFFRAVFTNVLAVLGPKAAIYCWHAHKRSGLIQKVWSDLGILDHQQIVWVKPASVFGRVYWHFRHEPCVMGWRQGQQPDHDGHHEHDSVWEVDWDGKARIQSDHPTSKPTELFARPMRKHTKPGAIVFEPFSGSGSQIIAAEQERRRCRAIELEPAFVDVAVRRWQEMTGGAAVLDGTGQTFDEVREARAS